MVTFALACALAGAPAYAQSPAEFYKGKTNNIICGFGAGGGYDLYARLLGRYLTDHIPGKPAVVVQNMEGAGSVRAANYVYASGAKDGTGIAGNIVNRGTLSIVQQPAAQAQNTAATLTTAQILAGIITSGPSGAINLELPLATAMDTAIPNSIANDAFDFSIINTAGGADTVTVTTDTGWTLVGYMAIAQNVSGRFRAQKTGAGAWTLFRLS